jgi:cysteine synthase A
MYRMAKIYNNLLETIGNTPLVRINALNTTDAQVLAKVEFFNPCGSVKDRIGLAMLEAAESRAGLTRIQRSSNRPWEYWNWFGLCLRG